MTKQTRIIVFCYAYIIGIVFAMLAPADAASLMLLRVITTLAFGALAASMIRAWMRNREISTSVCIVLLLLAGVLLGYTRHTGADKVPDARIGDIRIVEGVPVLRQTAALPDTCRLRLRKTESLDEDVVLRIHGELDARLPAGTDDSMVEMDEAGRWIFRIVQVAQESEPIVVRKDDPLGTDYFVRQPFSRVSGVELLSGPRNGVLALYRVSNHMGSFLRGSRSAPVTILGRVSADPRIYGFKTVLPVTPMFIQQAVGGPFLRVEGGDVHVTIKPGTSDYEKLSHTDAYGYDLQIRGELSMPREASNPGGFNPRRFLQNNNVYGMVSVFQRPDGDAPVRIVAPGGIQPRAGNALVEFSLALRDRMVRVFKQSVPYPHSAFLGGVTLGLRYGLQGVSCLFAGDADPSSGQVGAGCEEEIAEEFKEAGVNHVLAVSGLHVTIITLMFVGIFAMLRMPRQLYVPVIILALVVFSIITGARPSVLRAVIMNGLLLLSWAYLDQNLRASALLGVPVAAFLILLQNPLVLVDPSFTLSFGAILSLALMTGPVYEMLSKLRGNMFIAFVIALIGLTAMGSAKWALVTTTWFPAAAVGGFGLLFFLARRIERHGIKPIGGFGYADIPPSIGAFLAAQFAIQIGMMIPLSAYYFSRWPFAGAYANLLAIPLIGVVVQLAAIAGMLGLIPVVGTWLALILGAANWVFSTAFLWLAHFSAAVFPYPFVRKASPRFLIFYYLLCALFVWNKPVMRWVRQLCARLGWRKPWSPAMVVAGVVVAMSSVLWIGGEERVDDLKVTVLSVGYGSSILVETPAGRNILIDCGYVEHERGRRNEAIRTVLPYLSMRGIRRLDALVLTSPSVERTAGASYVVEHCRVDELCLPAGMGSIGEVPMDEFLSQLCGGSDIDAYSPWYVNAFCEELLGNPSRPRRLSLAGVLRSRRDTIANRLAGSVVKKRIVRAGDVLFKEERNGKTFRVEVLNPAKESFDTRPIENMSMVLRIVHGDFAMLITSDLHYEGQRALAMRLPASELTANVMVVPHRGAALPPRARRDIKRDTQDALESSLEPLLEKVEPKIVIFETGNMKPVLRASAREAEQVQELTWRYLEDRLGRYSLLSTERDMAIMIASDGKEWSMTTQAQLNSASGGDDGSADEMDASF